MEPQGNQEFVEANVTVAGSQLALSLNNKVAIDIMYRLPPYQQKLSSKVSKAVLSGILTRVLQSTNDDELGTICILALSYEAQHYKLHDCLIKQVVSHARTKGRERKEKKVERALAKASLALEK